MWKKMGNLATVHSLEFQHYAVEYCLTSARALDIWTRPFSFSWTSCFVSTLPVLLADGRSLFFYNRAAAASFDTLLLPNARRQQFRNDSKQEETVLWKDFFEEKKLLKMCLECRAQLLFGLWSVSRVTYNCWLFCVFFEWPKLKFDNLKRNVKSVVLYC